MSGAFMKLTLMAWLAVLALTSSANLCDRPYFDGALAGIVMYVVLGVLIDLAFPEKS
jgi:predicted membrane channel-forming protein YqfA (hemolysin III family)